MQQELERIEPGSLRAVPQVPRRSAATSTRPRSSASSAGTSTRCSSSSPRRTCSKVLKIRAHKMMYPEVARLLPRRPAPRRAHLPDDVPGHLSRTRRPAVYGLLPVHRAGGRHLVPRGRDVRDPARAREALPRARGRRFHYRATVQRIVHSGARATGLQLDDGRTVDADLVLCNADLPWAYKNLLDAEGAREAEERGEAQVHLERVHDVPRDEASSTRGCSTTTSSSAATTRPRSTTSSRSSRSPRTRASTSTSPSRTDPSLAPAGQGRDLRPRAGARTGTRRSTGRSRARRSARRCSPGSPSSASPTSSRTSRSSTTARPTTTRLQLNLERGSAFGLSHNFFQVGPFRPTNQDAHLRNLFFVGASTQPGTGLPMVMLSARLVTERITQHAHGTAPRAVAPSPAPRLGRSAPARSPRDLRAGHRSSTSGRPLRLAGLSLAADRRDRGGAPGDLCPRASARGTGARSRSPARTRRASTSRRSSSSGGGDGRRSRSTRSAAGSTTSSTETRGPRPSRSRSASSRPGARCARSTPGCPSSPTRASPRSRPRAPSGSSATRASCSRSPRRCARSGSPRRRSRT